MAHKFIYCEEVLGKTLFQRLNCQPQPDSVAEHEYVGDRLGHRKDLDLLASDNMRFHSGRQRLLTKSYDTQREIHRRLSRSALHGDCKFRCLRRRYPVEAECAFQRNYKITSMLRQRNDFHFHLSMAFRSVYAARQTLYHAISAHLREFPPRNALPFRLCNGKYFIRNIHVTYFQTVISLLYLMTLCQYGAKNHFQYHKAPVAIKSQTKAKVAKL